MLVPNTKVRVLNNILKELLNSKEYTIIEILDRNTFHMSLTNSILNFYNITEAPTNHYDTIKRYDNHFYIIKPEIDGNLIIGINKKEYQELKNFEEFEVAIMKQLLLGNIKITGEE